MKKDIYLCYKDLEYLEKVCLPAWSKLNDKYCLHLYDNKMCEEFINAEFGSLHRDVFNFIPSGPIKADFWRLCILYKKGGFYSDGDVEPLVSIDDFFDDKADFITCVARWPKVKRFFNPVFIGAKEGCSFLNESIEWYTSKYHAVNDTHKDRNKYEKKITQVIKDLKAEGKSGAALKLTKRSTYKYWDWSIMRCFTDVIFSPPDDYYESGDNTKQGAMSRGKNGMFKAKGRDLQIISQNTKGEYWYNDKHLFNDRFPFWDRWSHAPKSDYLEQIKN